jgi:hypothetical protein
MLVTAKVASVLIGGGHLSPLFGGGGACGCGNGCKTTVIRSGYFFHAPVAASTMPRSRRKKLATVAADKFDDKVSVFG